MTARTTPGLGLLPVQTIFAGEKATYQAQARILARTGWMDELAGGVVSGYEIHVGQTEGATPWLEITRRADRPVNVCDGAMNADGRVWGYLHGLFGNTSLRRAWLASLGWRSSPQLPLSDPFAESLARLADKVESSFDMELLERILWDSSF